MSALDFLIPHSGAGKAFLAVVLLGSGCGMIGCFVVLRRIALMGDTISHAVLPGVVAGLIYSPERNPLIIFSFALLAGLFGAGVVRALMKTTRLKSDAALGIVLASFFAFGIMWQSRNQQDTVGVMQYLFGSVGSIDTGDLKMMVCSTCALLLIIFVLKRPFFLMSFDEAFTASLGYPVRFLNAVFYFLLAFAVVVALQAVGVVLVTAMLITPAASAYLLTERFGKMLALSTLIGVGAGLCGVWVSSNTEAIPTGPVITLAGSALFFLIYLFAPHHGVLARFMRHRFRHRRVKRENTLKTIYGILESNGFAENKISVSALAKKQRRGSIYIKKQCISLLRYGFLSMHKNAETMSLTHAGWKRATEIVRNHRLWELYLTNEADYASDHVHEDAEIIEHILGANTVKKLEKELNFPEIDPHGEPIPDPKKPLATM